MKSFRFLGFLAIVFGLLIVLGMDSNLFAQGKSAGKSKGKSNVTKGPKKTTGASNRGGMSGRNDSEINRDRTRRNVDRMPNDNEIRRFRGVAKKLDTTPEALRADYRDALAANPNLRFGQFVSANVIADNLNEKHPDITTDAILDGLENGRSLGQTLQDLGLSSDESKEARKQAKRQIKESKRRERAKDKPIVIQ